MNGLIIATVFLSHQSEAVWSLQFSTIQSNGGDQSVQCQFGVSDDSRSKCLIEKTVGPHMGGAHNCEP